MEENFTLQFLLTTILDKIERVDYRSLIFEKDENEKITKPHYLVITIEEIIKISESLGFPLILKNETAFIYNTQYWIEIQINEFKDFLGNAAIKMGVPYYEGKYYGFIEAL